MAGGDKIEHFITITVLGDDWHNALRLNTSTNMYMVDEIRRVIRTQFHTIRSIGEFSDEGMKQSVRRGHIWHRVPHTKSLDRIAPMN